MRNTSKALLIASTILTMATSGAVLAQDIPAVVNFTLAVNQPTLFDSDKRDTFKGTVDDKSGTTTFTVECSAGSSALFGLSRTDEACALNGNGLIKNPNNPAQTAQRLNYSGGFTIKGKEDGYTDASTLLANYLRVGSAGAENKTFGGNLVMQPENPSASASALGAKLIKNLKEKAAGSTAVEFDTKIDAVRFDGFTIPNVGLPTAASCSWTGDLIYAYANDAWQGQFDVKCGDQTYHLEGNMPLVDAPAGADYQQEYDLNLVVPGDGGGDPFAAADPFATVTGVTGVFKMTNSGRNADGVYEKVQVAGELTGNGVPLELVRSYGQIMIILARTFYGA